MHCCGGWQIPVADERRDHLLTIEPKWVDLFTKKQDKWLVRQENGACVAMGKDGLCGVQSLAGHQHLPMTCSSYPRALYKWEEPQRTEVGGFISCPEVARQVLSGEGMDLVESPRKHRMNLAEEFPQTTPYYLQFQNFRSEILAVFREKSISTAMISLAHALALSPAFFHHSVRDDQTSRLFKRLREQQIDSDLIPSIEMVTDHFSGLYSLLQDPPKVNYHLALNSLNRALQWIEKNGVSGWIDADVKMMENPEMEKKITFLCRYEWGEHPYVVYPNLFIYWHAFQLRLILFRLFLLSNPDQTDSLSLACVERLMQHSAWLVNLQTKLLSKPIAVTTGLLCCSPWVLSDLSHDGKFL